MRQLAGGWFDVALGAAIGLVMACVIFDRSFFFGDDALVTGILGDAGIKFTDLTTSQSSLEEIFVGLVKKSA